MDFYEIENLEWEESIKYYFSSKELYSRNIFLDTVKSKENIEIDIAKSKVISFHPILNNDDFLIKKMLDWNEVILFLLYDDWDYKIILIETTKDYILKIWSTSA